MNIAIFSGRPPHPSAFRLAAPALLLACLLGLAACKDSGKAEAQAPVERKKVKVTVETVAPRPMNDLLVLPGETEALHDVKLAAERGGRVDFVGPKEGDRVKAGAVIARIDMQALAAALDKAEAAFKRADELADRRVALYGKGVLSKEDLDQAETERALARGSLRQAQSDYRQGSVLAPVDGVINKLFVDPGEVVGVGDPVADLVNVETIRVNVSVPEMDVRFLAKGQQAPVTVDAFPGERWDGVVDFVAFKADPATKTFQARLVVRNAERRIRPGMLARVVFQRRNVEDALTAPLFAILDKSGERLVFVEENGVARARNVSIGVIEGDRAQILSGLVPGDRLIVTGQTEVEDGTEVLAQ